MTDREPSMPSDAEFFEWERLAVIGYNAHRASIVASLRDSAWEEVGVITQMQWISAAEAIHKAIRASDQSRSRSAAIPKTLVDLICKYGDVRSGGESGAANLAQVFDEIRQFSSPPDRHFLLAQVEKQGLALMRIATMPCPPTEGMTDADQACDLRQVVSIMQSIAASGLKTLSIHAAIAKAQTETEVGK